MKERVEGAKKNYNADKDSKPSGRDVCLLWL